MRTTTTPTAKSIVAPAPDHSRENHSESISSIFGNNNNNDRPPVIGTSLLPFLPSDPSKYDCERKNNRVSDHKMCDDAIPEIGAEGFHNNAAPERNNNPENETALCGALDDSARSKSHRCSSFLRDGKTSAASIGGSTGDDRCHQPQERNKQQNRSSRERILLRGPPGSGKTSLGMNLAYAEASAEKNCCDGLPCDCVAAIVYRPNERRHSDNNHNDDEYSSDGDRFPLFCRALPAQIGEALRKNTDERTKEISAPTVLGNAEAAATKRDEQDSWDPTILNRIRICRVSSVRDLWEDMLVLAGKPFHEQPTRAIVLEDLDQIIGSERDLSNHNHISGSSGKNKKHNYVVAMMLKTVAIAADTAFAIETNRNGYSVTSSLSHSKRVTLLVTLTMDPPQQQRGASMIASNRGLRSAATNPTDLSNILVLASCIDTVVTLRQRHRDIDNMARETDNGGGGGGGDGKNISCFWRKPMTASKMTRSNKGDEDCNTNNNKNYFSNETIEVNSVWQAEIQECGDDQYYGNIGDGVNGDTNGVSLIDYAFVESCLVEDGNFGLDEYEGGKELRWRYRNAIS